MCGHCQCQGNNVASMSLREWIDDMDLGVANTKSSLRRCRGGAAVAKK